MDKNGGSKQLESIFTSSDLAALSQEYGEIAIDGFLDDGILKDIPILGTAVSLVTFGNSVSKKIFIKKMYKFLFQLREVPEEKRLKLMNRINSSGKYQTKVGETIFEILESLESEGKPEIVGKLFAATLDEKIDYLDFLRLSYIVKNQFYFDLVALKNHVKKGNIVGIKISDSLFTSGLVNTKFLPMLDGDEQRDPDTGLTDLGKMLLDIGMSENEAE